MRSRPSLRAQQVTAWAGRSALIATLGLGGCLLPEIDTPPIDQSLIEEQTEGGGGGGGAACVTGTFQGGFDIVAGMEDLSGTGYEGQCDVQGNVTIDVDAPAAQKLSQLRTISGNLVLMGQGPLKSQVTLLNSLTQAGNILIQGTLLHHTPKLPKLSTVKEIIVRNNAQLQDIAGFDALTSFSTLTINNNAVLTTIAGFGKVTEASGRIDVQQNHQLTTFTAFANMAKHTNYLRIENGPVSKIGFSKLTSAGQFQLSQLGVEQVSLPALQAVGKLELGYLTSLKIIDKTSLKTINGMSLDHLPLITNIDWIPATAKLTGTANVCTSGQGLIEAVNAWVQASGSTGNVTAKLCKP